MHRRDLAVQREPTAELVDELAWGGRSVARQGCAARCRGCSSGAVGREGPLVRQRAQHLDQAVGVDDSGPRPVALTAAVPCFNSFAASSPSSLKRQQDNSKLLDARL